MLLFCVALALPAAGQPAQFLRRRHRPAPPQIPPQIDAINFVNDNFFSITFTNLDYSGDTLTYNPVLFQPVDTLNFTNFAYIAVNPAYQFPHHPFLDRSRADGR